MKNKMKFLFIIPLVLVAAGFATYSFFMEKAPQQAGVVYVCPMHPQVQQDEPGECPICHMTLVPLKKTEDHSQHSVNGANIPSAQQNVMGLKLATAELKPANKETQVSGKIAFDLDLLTAQEEFLLLQRSGSELAKASRQRLQLFGMSEASIQELIKRGRAEQSLVDTTAPRWVTASLFAEEAKQVSLGLSAKVIAQDGHVALGKIKTLEPVLGSTNRLVQVRIELDQADKNFRAQELVRVLITIPLGEALLVPRAAVLDSGTRKIVMVAEHAEHFVPREVKVGALLGDEWIIQEGLSAGEKVVVDAAFLVDAESQLKSAIGDANQHQHGGE